jgi:large subunit ribosomal protein L10
MNSAEKNALTAEFTDAFAAAGSSFLVSYQGTKTEDLTKLRRSLRPSGAKLRIVKNTLARKALKGTAGEKLEDLLAGPVAVIWAKSDPVGPAKILAEFSKTVETFQVKGGVVDGQVVSANAVAELAKLPSKEELQSKLLSVLNAPATKLLQLLNAPATQMVGVLGSWQRKLEEKGGEAKEA